MPNSVDRAADERELMDAIWRLVLTESYRFNQMEQYDGLPRAAVVERYLAQNPEWKRFLERHIEAGTCAQGARDLRERMAQWSAAYRQSLPPRPQPAPRPRTFLRDWGRRAAEPAPTAPPEAQIEGPADMPTATTEAQIEGTAEAGEACRQRRALSRQVFEEWWDSFPSDAKPGSREVNSWATEQGYSTTDARRLFHQMPDRREPGRPKKRA